MEAMFQGLTSQHLWQETKFTNYTNVICILSKITKTSLLRCIWTYKTHMEIFLGLNGKTYKENRHQEELTFFVFMVFFTEYFLLFHFIIVLPSPQKSCNLGRWHCMVIVKWPRTNYPQTRATAIKLWSIQLELGSDVCRGVCI